MSIPGSRGMVQKVVDRNSLMSKVAEVKSSLETEGTSLEGKECD
jgi:hypothetical protein